MIAAFVVFASAAAGQEAVPKGQPSQALPAPSTAEVPPIPATPSLAAANRGGSAAVSMFGALVSARRGFCARLRASPLGKLVSGLRKPLSTVTGGLIPAEKAPHPDEKAQPGAAGSAAQVKSAKLEAPKRRAAVAGLCGVDVRYHPEAETSLIAALRADPSECVRYEAAVTLATLPVCTKKIAEALRVCFERKNVDGNPAELSERVRMQAAVALSHCQTCLPPGGSGGLNRPEYPETAVSTAGLDRAIDGRDAALTLPISSALRDGSGRLGHRMIASAVIPVNHHSPASDESSPSTLGNRAPGAETHNSRHAPLQRPGLSKPPGNLLEVFRAATAGE